MVQIRIDNSPYLFTIRLTSFEALTQAIIRQVQTTKILPLAYFDSTQNAFVLLKEEDISPLQRKTHVKIRLGKSESPRYEGELNSHGEKHGYGVYKWPGGRIYMGQWYQNQMDGEGVESWPTGAKYQGQYLENKRHGQGTFTWPDGRSYTGEYYEDQRHGYGVCEFANGYRYEGQWCQGKKHGRGIEIFPDGHRYTGIFQNDKAIASTSE